MKHLKWWVTVMALLLLPEIFGQRNQTIGNVVFDETLLYAEVKQMNQFFRRFNNEEDARGVKYATESPYYQNNEIRIQYFNSLFDKYSLLLNPSINKEFSDFVLNKKKPFYLDFYKTHWFAEVSAKVLWNNTDIKDVIYYLKIEADRLGHKWVISNIYFAPFDNAFPTLPDSIKDQHFLHPKSHEIDFINMPKEFRNIEFLSAYFQKDFSPDMLTLFLYESNKGNIRFLNVNTVKFHFVLDEAWYFEVSYLNRNETNCGWLITNLLKIETEATKELLNTFD